MPLFFSTTTAKRQQKKGCPRAGGSLLVNELPMQFGQSPVPPPLLLSRADFSLRARPCPSNQPASHPSIRQLAGRSVARSNSQSIRPISPAIRVTLSAIVSQSVGRSVHSTRCRFWPSVQISAHAKTRLPLG